MLLMDDQMTKNLTLRSEEQPIVGHPGSNTVKYKLMTALPSKDYMPGSLVLGFILDPHSTDFDKPIIHNTEEIVIVTEGEVTVRLIGETIFLKPGDTTIITKNMPHSITNDLDTPAVGLSIMTPAIWSIKYE